MARQKKTNDKKKSGSAALGFEATLWAMADKQRGHMDAAEYKHVVLGLIFLKYISDAFEEKHKALVEEKKKGADPEDKDEYLAENIFWVPKEARWTYLQANAKQPKIGTIIDDAMVAIERDNTSLKGVLPKDFNRPALDKHLLGGLIDLIGTINLRPSPLAPLPMGEGTGEGAKRGRGAEGEGAKPGHYRGGYDFSGLVQRAREMRKAQTPAEEILWELVRDRRFLDLKFRRQHQIGDYVVDFFCNEKKLIIELDGSVHSNPKRQKTDHKRDAYLRSQGFTVMRFSNTAILESPEMVLRDIADAIAPSPSGRGEGGEGNIHRRSMDILGRVYEYFLSQFASAEGKKGGQFYTPRCVVQVLVGMLAPYKGRVFDPCCGSGGMFVQSEKFVEAHGGRVGDISIFGQESNPTTWKLAKMNLAIRGIETNLGSEHADSFHANKHKDLKADYILANPPFNMSDWGGDRLREDSRWKYGVPPAGNANYAWVQHFIHHLAPNGIAGFVLANGSMSSNTSGEGEIRKNIIEADIVDCMVAMPGQLFYSTQIPVCLFFLTRNKKNGRFRDRRGETLFIDARKMGSMVDRVHRELTDEDIAKIAGTYHAWRGDKNAGEYVDVPGFCKAAEIDDIRKHGHVLTPGRYVGAEAVEDDAEPFEEKMVRLTATLRQQTGEAAKLDAAITVNLKGLGYEF